MQKILDEAKARDIEAVVTTEKDSVKINELIPASNQIPVFALGVEMDITENEQKLLDRLYGISAS